MVEAKVKAIMAKIYAAAFYGIDAVGIPVAKIATFTAAVIDVSRSRWFFAAFIGDHSEIDLVAQIFARRALQVRGAICKRKGANGQFKAMLGKYAAKNKDQWPKWCYQYNPENHHPPTTFPGVQPHPATKAHEPNWSDEIQAKGPIGLLIEAVLWNGLVIDNDLKIWQKHEEPIDLVIMPYQNLQTQLLMMAARARTLAEWDRRHHEFRKALLGYDPEVWLETDVQIRDSDQTHHTYNKMNCHHR